MAPTVPSVDNATLKALRKSDTSALEKIHRAWWDTINAEATKQGGDPTFGPPVAELAMLQVWEGRANIENLEELTTAVQAAVRGGVTREQRRRANAKGESSNADFRITVTTSTLWGIVGVGIIAVALLVLLGAVARFGRR